MSKLSGGILLIAAVVLFLGNRGQADQMKRCKDQKSGIWVRCEGEKAPDKTPPKEDEGEKKPSSKPGQAEKKKSPKEAQGDKKEPPPKKSAQEVCEDKCDLFHDQAVDACQKDPECGEKERARIAAAYLSCVEGCEPAPS